MKFMRPYKAVFSKTLKKNLYRKFKEIMCLYISPIKKLLINRWIENLLNIYLGIPFFSCFGFKDKILVPY